MNCGPSDNDLAQALMDEKVEQLISERLVLGWTLCNDDSECPNDNVPLMINNTVSETVPDGVKVAQPTDFSARAIGKEAMLYAWFYFL